MAYDVFVSYSHAGDELISERVQDGLVRFAKPWWRRRALNVFRDRSGLAANPGLWTAICEAIDDSRYFLILASPESAASPWCEREINRWRSAHGADRIILLLTAGTIAWDEAANDFDWQRTDALDPVLGSCFREEPRWIDMRWARSELQLDLSDGRFSDQIAEIAAPIHGVAKDELIGSDVRQHRRTIRHAVIAAAALMVMTVASATMALYAVQAAASATRSAERARKANAAELVQTKIARAATAAEKLKEQQAVALRARANQSAQAVRRANTSLQRLNGQLRLTINQRDASNSELNIAVGAVKLENGRLNTSNRALTSSELASTARLAARRGEQLLDAGDQTYSLGLLLTAESLRHWCASNAVKQPTVALATDTYPDSGCDSDLEVDPTVLASARLALAGGAGRQFTVAQLADIAPVDPTALIGTDPSNGRFNPIAWSADGRRFTTLSTGQTGGSAVVEVWDRSGSPVASVTSPTHLTSQAALSGDGNVLAVTANPRPGVGMVSVWSLVSGSRLLADTPGRAPSVSANGSVVAWISDHGPPRVEIGVHGAATRAVGLPAPPAAVTVSPDGGVAVVLLADGGNNYSVVPVATATGTRGPVLRLPAISVATGDSWANPPRMFGSADPPMLTFGDHGTAWIYNNERHVGVRLVASAHGPVLQLRTNQSIVDSETYLRAATPNGATVTAAYNDTAGHTIVTIGGPTANVRDIASLSLCASNACQFGLSPDGTLLLVRSLSVLQLIDLSKPASATTTLPLPYSSHAESVLMSPSGVSAIRWDDRDVYTIDAMSRKQARVSLLLATAERVQSVDFSPGGDSYAVLITNGDRCPCRVATVPALGTRPVADVQLRGPLPKAVDAASVALDDGAVRVGLAVGASATSGGRRCALITFDATTGRQLLQRDNQQLTLGCESWSRPAFAPNSHIVAVVATGIGAAKVAGVLLDADTGAAVHRLSLAPGETTTQEGGTYGYALRFSRNGRYLAWNSGGGVVVWTTSESPLLVSQTVLAYPAAFDPNAVAVSDNGSVATVGKRIYSTTFVGNFDSLLTADALGRFFAPLGGAAVVGDAADGQMSVAVDAGGVISTATLDAGTSNIVITRSNSSPRAVLAALCAEASGTLSPAQWALYFPDEPYHPACVGATPAPPLQINAGSPSGAVEPASIRRAPLEVATSAIGTAAFVDRIPSKPRVLARHARVT